MANPQPDKYTKPKIEGGYILLARKITISDIMKKPPLYMKLWVWMLESANRKDGYRGLERGQFFTTKNDMREAMSWMVGYRKVTPTEKEIRNPYEWFLQGRMIVTKKGTHGTLITICNYDEYQNPKNYEGQSEGRNEIPTKGETGAKYKQEVKEIQEVNKELIKDIIDCLNLKTGKNYKPNTKKTITTIQSRIKEGFTKDDFIKVIDIKSKAWVNNPKMNEYLRPETLFGNKFEGYLNSGLSQLTVEPTHNYEEL